MSRWWRASRHCSPARPRNTPRAIITTSKAVFITDFEPCSSSFGTRMSGTAAPLQRQPQTFLEADLRHVTEQSSGLRDIRLRVADVAGARILIYRLQVRPHDLVQRPKELVQRD